MDTSILAAFRDHRGKTSWGRIAGSVILVVIFAVWATLSLRRGEWVAFDPFTSALVVGVYTTQAYKSVKETPAAPASGNTN